jgi:hypothetical protein
MNVTGPGAGIPRQGFPTEARIEAPQPQDQALTRAAPVDEGGSSQRSRDESSAPPRADAPPSVDIMV